MSAYQQAAAQAHGNHWSYLPSHSRRAGLLLACTQPTNPNHQNLKAHEPRAWPNHRQASLHCRAMPALPLARTPSTKTLILTPQGLCLAWGPSTGLVAAVANAWLHLQRAWCVACKHRAVPGGIKHAIWRERENQPMADTKPRVSMHALASEPPCATCTRSSSARNRMCT